MKIPDQRGQIFAFDKPPERVISLCPSITKTLYDMGLEKYICGITRYCIYPSHLKEEKTLVGGVHDIKTDIVTELKPEIIFVSKEENPKEIVEELEKDFNCFVFDINDLSDSIEMISLLGLIFNIQEKALAMINQIQGGLDSISGLPLIEPSLYLVWKKPFMIAGGYSYTGDLLKKCGFTLPDSLKTERYPKVDLRHLKGNRFCFLLPDEPWVFKNEDAEELLKEFPDSYILLIKGEWFSWFGTACMELSGIIDKMRKEMVNRPADQVFDFRSML